MVDSLILDLINLNNIYLRKTYLIHNIQSVQNVDSETSEQAYVNLSTKVN